MSAHIEAKQNAINQSIGYLPVGTTVGEVDGIILKVGDADGALMTFCSYLSSNTANIFNSISIESIPTLHL